MINWRYGVFAILAIFGCWFSIYSTVIASNGNIRLGYLFFFGGLVTIINALIIISQEDGDEK